MNVLKMTSSGNGFPLKPLPSAAAEMAPMEGINVHLELLKHGPSGCEMGFVPLKFAIYIWTNLGPLKTYVQNTKALSQKQPGRGLAALTPSCSAGERCRWSLKLQS